MEIEKLETFINTNKLPMLRKCENCNFWQRLENDKRDTGYCKRAKLYFAHTLEKTRYYQTKFCDLCPEHQFKNEAQLSQVCEKVLLKDIIKPKSEIKNVDGKQ